jgi:Tol biopolymer transport system component
MISCAYPTYNSIGGREIIIERRRVIPVFTESDGQQQLLIMTFKYIATLGTAEKSESISSVTRITNNVNKGEIGHPAISPDGKEIVFQYWQPGANSCNIWAVPTDGGTAIRRITDSDNYYNLYPAWSPDGMNIIFCSNRLGQQFNLWKVKSKGYGGITQLTSSNTPDCFPHVSPNGEKIVFSTLFFSASPFGNVTPTMQIWTMNFDGSELTQIRDGRMPKWAGNDELIFVSSVDEYNHLWLMNSNGSNVTQLTFGNGNDEYPDVSPDGKRIVFCSNWSGNRWNIWTVNRWFKFNATDNE